MCFTSFTNHFSLPDPDNNDAWCWRCTQNAYAAQSKLYEIETAKDKSASGGEDVVEVANAVPEPEQSSAPPLIDQVSVQQVESENVALDESNESEQNQVASPQREVKITEPPPPFSPVRDGSAVNEQIMTAEVNTTVDNPCRQRHTRAHHLTHLTTHHHHHHHRIIDDRCPHRDDVVHCQHLIARQRLHA